MIKQNEIKVLLMANVHGGNLHHIYADTEILSARLLIILWDRPFNLKGGVMVFGFVQKNFFGQHESQNIFFCRAKRKFFYQNLTLGYMTKTLNQIIFFHSTTIRIFFFSNIGNQNIFLEKKHNPPPPPFKLNGRSLSMARYSRTFIFSLFSYQW